MVLSSFLAKHGGEAAVSRRKRLDGLDREGCETLRQEPEAISMHDSSGLNEQNHDPQSIHLEAGSSRLIPEDDTKPLR